MAMFCELSKSTVYEMNEQLFYIKLNTKHLENSHCIGFCFLRFSAC